MLAPYSKFITLFSSKEYVIQESKSGFYTSHLIVIFSFKTIPLTAFSSYFIVQDHS